MENYSQTTRGARYTRVAFFLLMIFFIAASVTTAQKKSGAAKKDPSAGTKTSDQMLATWKAEAKAVANDLRLSKEQRGKLTDAFIAARKSQRDAVKALPEETDREKSRAATLGVNTKERATLEKSLKGILTNEQIAKALPLLGSFNHRWDTMVKTLSELKLEKEKMNAALKLVGTFVTDYEKARSEATASGSRFSSSTSRDLKEKLDAGISKLLSAEQLKTWNEATKSGKDTTKDAKEKAKGADDKKKGGKDKTKGVKEKE